ncbi:MAG: glycosyltransferase [SAR202 cluster bacterium]|nr:glycosyltransferase [SAR202 cluster bacterium]
MVNRKPAISVVIPAFNGAAFLPRSIGSVLGQIFPDFELIVVDDGSTDDTSEVVKAYLGDKRVRYLYQPNKGLPGARNTGINESAADLISFLDCDDEWLPEKLSLQFAAMADSAFSACYGAARFVLPGGQTKVMRGIQREPRELYRQLLFKNVLYGATSSIVVRRECFDRLGPFDERLVSCEDRDMWLRLSKEDRIKYIDQELIRFERTRPDAMTKNRVKMAEGRIGLLENIEQGISTDCRRLLPRVRWWHYRRIAALLANDRPAESRKYAIKAITASWRADSEALQSIRLLGRGLLPARLVKKARPLPAAGRNDDD